MFLNKFSIFDSEIIYLEEDIGKLKKDSAACCVHTHKLVLSL